MFFCFVPLALSLDAYVYCSSGPRGRAETRGRMSRAVYGTRAWYLFIWLEKTPDRRAQSAMYLHPADKPPNTLSALQETSSTRRKVQSRKTVPQQKHHEALHTTIDHASRPPPYPDTNCKYVEKHKLPKQGQNRGDESPALTTHDFPTC